jgi:uncharacterized membrane protein YcgQ (UPF0703/DUF1980 family)
MRNCENEMGKTLKWKFNCIYNYGFVDDINKYHSYLWFYIFYFNVLSFFILSFVHLLTCV